MRLPSIKPIWILLALYLGFCALIAWACYGVRGSDQFWYMQEISTLIERKAPISNVLGSGTFYRQIADPETNWFIHHSGVHYIVLPLAKLIGPFRGWIATSAILAMIASACLMHSVVLLTGQRSLGLLVAAISLFLPCMFWQHANMLQESIVSSWGSIILLLTALAIKRQTWSLWITGFAVSLLGTLLHPIFSFWTLGWLAAFGLVADSSTPKRIIAIATMMAMLLLIAPLRTSVFPSIFPESIHEIMAYTGAGEKQMLFYYSYGPGEDVNFAYIAAKAMVAIKYQVAANSRILLFNGPFNLLVIVAALGFWANRKERHVRALGVISVSVFGAWALMVICHQNQFRYNAPVTPPLLLLCAVTVSSGQRMSKLLQVGMVSLAVISVLLSPILANYLRNDALVEKGKLAETESLSAAIPNGAKILQLDPLNEIGQRTSYALRDHVVLKVPKWILNDPRTAETVQRFSPEYILDSASTVEPSQLVDITGDNIQRMDSGTKKLILYKCQ